MQDFASGLLKKINLLWTRNGTVSSVDRRRRRRGGPKETRNKRKVCLVRRSVTAVVALFGATYRVVDCIRRYLGRREKEEVLCPYGKEVIFQSSISNFDNRKKAKGHRNEDSPRGPIFEL